MKRIVSLELKREDSIDTVDNQNNTNLEGSDEGKLGFDLMSLTARRGHFVDQVSSLIQKNKYRIFSNLGHALCQILLVRGMPYIRECLIFSKLCFCVKIISYKL